MWMEWDKFWSNGGAGGGLTLEGVGRGSDMDDEPGGGRGLQTLINNFLAHICAGGMTPLLGARTVFQIPPIITRIFGRTFELPPADFEPPQNHPNIGVSWNFQELTPNAAKDM